MGMMSVESGLESMVLKGTDLAVSSPFTVHVDRGDGLRLTATVHVVDGQLVCRALELSTDHGRIDPNVLRRLGLPTLIRQAANAVAGRVGVPTSIDALSRFEAPVIRSELQRHIKGLPLVGPRRLTDDFLKQVAATYRQAREDGEAVGVAVARLQESWFHIRGQAPAPTANRWIAAARAATYLEKTTQGRKGARPS